MIDDLTDRLHTVSGNLPVPPRSPAELRAHAERGRRMRHLAGGLAICAVAIALIAGSAWISRGFGSARVVPPISPPTNTSTPAVESTKALEPPVYELMVGRDRNVVIVLEVSEVEHKDEVKLELAFESAIDGERGRCFQDGTRACEGSTPTSRPTSGVYVLATSPTLSDPDLLRFQNLAAETIGPWTAQPAGISAAPKLTDCRRRLDDLGASERHTAAFVATRVTDRGQAQLNEFVLRFATEDAAGRAYAAVRGQAVNCPSHTSYEEWIPILDDSTAPIQGWIDEVFIAVYQRST